MGFDNVGELVSWATGSHRICRRSYSEVLAEIV